MSERTVMEKPTGQQLEGADNESDYVFRFRINTRERPLNPDTLLIKFYKEQIQDLLKIVFFSQNGEKIIPTEFGFLNEPERKYPLT